MLTEVERMTHMTLMLSSPASEKCAKAIKRTWSPKGLEEAHRQKRKPKGGAPIMKNGLFGKLVISFVTTLVKTILAA